MNMQSWKTRRTLATVLVLVVVFIIVGVIAGKAGFKSRKIRALQTTSDRQQEEQRVQTTLPETITSVKDLQVVNAYIDSSKQANITVFNNSNKGIQGLAVSSGSFTVIDDDVIHDNPRTLVAPYASYTIQFAASNVRATLPIVISGVIYDDDSEAGDVSTRQNMRDTRAQQKEKRLSESKEKKGN